MGPKILEWINQRLPLSDFLEKHLTGYPTPKNINYLWNSGSVAMFFVVLQIATGIWLTMYYKPDAVLAFASVEHIMRDVHYGWLVRYLHVMGSTGLFCFMYIHIGRGMYYGSYHKPRELIWFLGLALYFCFMSESFLGYLLPWGQLSYWGATVITNLFEVIPVIGPDFVIWLRGDFAIGDATLSRFFSFHTTLIPVAIVGGVLILHLAALHKVGSNNPDGVDIDKKGPKVLPFYPYFVMKDMWFLSAVLVVTFYFVFFQPDFFLEPINSEEANPLLTPAHIVPEWYFLPFYAILKAVPNKFLGVVAMFASTLILFFMPYLDRSKVRSLKYRPASRLLLILFFVTFVLLGYVGFNTPDSMSFLGIQMGTLGRILTTYYFAYFILLPIVSSRERTLPLPNME